METKVACVLVTVLGVALLAAGIGHAQQSGQATGIAGTNAQMDHPPESRTTVSLSPSKNTRGSDIILDVRWRVEYPARSTAEAAKAKNGSLDTSWFRGKSDLESVVSNHPWSRLTDDRTTVQHHPDSSMEHGRIEVQYRADWRPLFGDRDQVVLGPAIGDRLTDGDEFGFFMGLHSEGVISSSVEVQYLDVTQKGYIWQIGEDPPPRLVLDRQEMLGYLFEVPVLEVIYPLELLLILVVLVPVVVVSIRDYVNNREED